MVLWSACTAGIVAAALAADSTALRGGTVVNPDGSKLENATVVMENGRITAVGADVQIPADAIVTEAAGKVLFPGMILAHTQIGLDVPNENVPVAPFVNVYDAIEPNSMEWEECLRGGIATVHVVQSNNVVIGGLSRVVKPVGDMVEVMTVRPDYALKLSMTPRSGFNRMTQMAELRRAFEELKQHVADVAERRYEEEQKKKDLKVLVPPDEASKEGMQYVTIDDLDSRWRTLWRASKGEIPLFVHCDRASDVLRGIEWLKEMKLLDKSVFVVGTEAFKVVNELKAAGRPVVLSGVLVHKEPDPKTGKDVETFVPKVFADAGVPFVLQPNGFGFTADGQLWYQAARCVREGVPREAALKAITQSAADAIGMGDVLGSITAGKWGNVAVLSGDPLAQSTVVERLFIEGKPVYDRTTDRRLKELISGEPSPTAGPKAQETTTPPTPPTNAEGSEPAKPQDGAPAKPEGNKPEGGGGGGAHGNGPKGR
jgi:imidazolonepropionase-like amidohydrolase